MQLRRLAPYLFAACAVSPLVGATVWGGLRFGLSDPVLSVIAASEQPLSVRTFGGVWAMALALAWFGLAYWRRDVTWWEATLVLVGSAAALARLGNLWLDAVALVLPLGRQVRRSNLGLMFLAVATAGCLGMGVLVTPNGRPPALPLGTAQTVIASASRGKILADWRWAGELQQRVGSRRVVLAAGGLTSQTPDFWLSYVEIAQGHERWATALRQLDVDLVVLEDAQQQRGAADLVRNSPDWHVLSDTGSALVAERIGA
jgi:hypothetical protein